MKKIPLTLITGLSALAMSASAQTNLLVNGGFDTDAYATGGNHASVQDIDAGWAVKSQSNNDIIDDGSTTNNVMSWTSSDIGLLADGVAQIVSTGGAAGDTLTLAFDWTAVTGSDSLLLNYQVVAWKLTGDTADLTVTESLFNNINGSTKTVSGAPDPGATGSSMTVFDLYNGGTLTGTPSNGSTGNHSGATFGQVTGVAGSTVAFSETISLSGFDAGFNDLSDYTHIGVRFHIDSATTLAAGSYIDDVVLSVPEPSAYALLSGLLALSFVMVRRRK